MNRTNVPSEASEQTALFEWAEYAACSRPELRLLFHCPNGGSRNPREAHNLKLQGVKAGVPDICLPVARGGYHGLYIELKRTKGGRLSEEQRAWLACLTRQGYKAVMCHGWLDAKQTIIGYLDAQKDLRMTFD